MLRVLHLERYIDAVVTAEDVTRGKPEPDVFLAAAGKLGVPASRSIVVEDAAAGVEGARRAGMRSIGVNPRSALAADIYVRSLADLAPDAFDRLLEPAA
jgi:beta-phosphoglucomutase-like phosphatase (HAD superfamily)